MSDIDPGNFLTQVKQIITGSNLGQAADGGYLVDFDVTSVFNSFVLSGSTGAYGANSTSPLSTGVITPTLPTLISTAASTFGPFWVPRNYDQTSDQLMFRILGSTSTTGNPSVTISGALTIYAPGQSTSSTTTVQTNVQTFTSATFQNFGLDFSGNGLQYGDAFKLTLSTSGPSIPVLGVAETYSSVLVAWQDYNGNALLTGGTVATETVNGSTYEIRTR